MHFLQTLVLAHNFRLIPNTLISEVGDSMRLHLRLSEETVEPVSLLNLRCFLCCHLSTPKVVPKSIHVRYLKYLVFQMCIVQPFLGFLEVVIDWEYGIGAHWVEAFSRRHLFTTICRFSSMIIGLGACRGIAGLVEVMNPNAKAAHLDKIVKYCQSYVLGMNLLPNLLSRIPAAAIWGGNKLSNGDLLSQAERAQLLRSVFVLLGALLCTLKAFKAFPVDQGHYPELFTEAIESTEPLLRPQQSHP